MPLPEKSPPPAVFSANGNQFEVRLFSCQPICWICLTPPDPSVKSIVDDGQAFFPALIDTGTTESLVLHEWHLLNWAGLSLSALKLHGKLSRMWGHEIPGVKADIWISTWDTSPYEPPATGTPAAKVFVQDGRILVSQLYSGRDLITADGAGSPVYGRVGEPAYKGGVPVDIQPRLPVLGVQLLRANRLAFAYRPGLARYSLLRERERQFGV